MQATDLLRMQLQGSCELVSSHAGTAGSVWGRRAFAGASTPGFALWHCARMIDWGVRAVVRDIVELGAAEPWSTRVRYDLGHGTGMSEADTDEVVRTVTPDSVAAYAAALGDDIGAWIDTVTATDLDATSDLHRACARHPRYATPQAWEEVESLHGIPAWQVLARPCIAHIRLHIGEVETLCQLLEADGAGEP